MKFRESLNLSSNSSGLWLAGVLAVDARESTDRGWRSEVSGAE